MYSKNDYRYYLENKLMHSDDFLAHYGVKGMKWKKHKRSNSTGDFKKGFSEGTDFFYKPGTNRLSRAIDEGTRGTRRTFEDGMTIGILDKAEKDYNNTMNKAMEEYRSSKKKNKKKKKKKNLFKRETPKGEKLKGSKNIYVDHNVTIK